MNSDEAFRRFAAAIASDPLDVLLAKMRRDAFTSRLRKIPGVVQVIHSGSLARGTYVGDIHDVDLIVVFDEQGHPSWGEPGESAPEALDYLTACIEERLGSGQGPLTRLAYGAKPRTHVVRCRDVWLGPFDGLVPGAPPVDVMPALRVGSRLRIPHRTRRIWEDTDPEKLIRLVAERTREWEYFDEVVRMVRVWAGHHDLTMKSPALEVLVLEYCPRPRFFETLSYGEAIARFFEEAASGVGIFHKLIGPTGRQMELGVSYSALRRALRKAADSARKAMAAERARENPWLDGRALKDPSFYWREIFGDKYPRSSTRLWQSEYFEPFSQTTQVPDGREHHSGHVHPEAGEPAGKASRKPSAWYPPSPPDRPKPGGPPPASPKEGPPEPPPPPGEDPGNPHGGDPAPPSTPPGPDRWEEYFERRGVPAVPMTFG